LQILEIDPIPLGPSGKFDRKALRRLEQASVMNDRLVIREFVQNLLSERGDRAALSDSEQLAERLQSIGTLLVVVFLEEEYGIDFAETGFDMNQVESIDSIMALIERREA
jgi:acyl carrier protein